MDSINTLSYLLQHVSAVLARQSDQVLLEQLGIGFSQFKILIVLQAHPGTQQRRIADTLGQTEASVSRQIKLLIDKGLLVSHVRPENRREHIAMLTPRGVRFTEQALTLTSKYQASSFDALSDKQKQQLRDILTIIHGHSCDYAVDDTHLLL